MATPGGIGMSGRDRIALVTSPGSYWGAEEAGLAVVEVSRAGGLGAALRTLLAAGEFGIIAVSEELAASDPDLAAALDQAPPEVSVVLVPSPGSRTVAGLALLRERFAVALGVDVWTAAAGKAGVDV
jgi:vacuolar-type H+-ATPase subunit F/Vma7